MPIDSIEPIHKPVTDEQTRLARTLLLYHHLGPTALAQHLISSGWHWCRECTITTLDETTA